MRKLLIVIFLGLMSSAICASVCSYRTTENEIVADVNNALILALAEMPNDVVTADTIRCYQSHLTISELKDTACISMRTVKRNGKQNTEMVAEANCGFFTILRLSNQRASCTLLFVAVLWLVGSMWYVRRYHPEVVKQGVRFGGIVFVDSKFYTETGELIHLTPMQYTLLEMFMESENHCLTKQEICEHLWPKKPDANDTLYTLIRRIKPIIESNSNIKIESDRGRSYRLLIK